MTKAMTGSTALIQSMINQGIKYVFGIPGAKVDQLFEDLQHSTHPQCPQLIVTRHEQNAAFIAAGIGRLTGNPGVVAVTSGPGVSNLATALITATAEGDPVIALGGQVSRDDVLRATHQSIQNAPLLDQTTKSSMEVANPENLSEAFANTYMASKSPKNGAAFLSLPQDILSAPVQRPVIEKLPDITNGSADRTRIKQIATMLMEAERPVILAGMRASTVAVSDAIHQLLNHYSIPVVETFQGSGIISRDLEANYFGRVGLFDNQIGDTVLKNSDLVLAIGYDPIEYEARNWHQTGTKIINVDTITPEITTDYQPQVIVNADVAQTLYELAAFIPEATRLSEETTAKLDHLKAHFEQSTVAPDQKPDAGLHPLAIINALQAAVNDDTTITVDIGSHYIWMARYFKVYKPRHLLFSNGMQTLGVALPWAIAAALTRPDQHVISISGDGGFLFSAQELETAVRMQLPIIQIIWVDGYYDMVKFQEVAKYGRDAGVKFGYVDNVKYAESFGAHGFRTQTVEEFKSALDAAKKIAGPSVIEVPVDYQDNIKLKTQLIPNELN